MRNCKLLLLLCIIWLFNPGSTYACVCGEKRSVAHELREAAAVFSGKVVAREYIEVNY